MDGEKFAVKPGCKDWTAINTYLSDYRKTTHGEGAQTGGAVTSIIDSRDEMYAFAIANDPSESLATLGYFRTGAQIQATLKQVYDWYFADKPGQKTILDFASGYGRGTRFLVDQFADDEVWASDILTGAMEFQSNHIGVHTIQSTTRPEDFNPDREFDLIWVVSLFTHLPKTSFYEWLGRLYSLLNPKGILAFTVHGTNHLPPGRAMPTDGFFFQPVSEIPTLNTEDYGSSVVTEDFVMSAIERCTGRKSYRRIERGVGLSQDLYLVSRAPFPDGELKFAHGPVGHLDQCILRKNGTLFLFGWAFDITPGHDVAKIEVFLNGRLIATPVHKRPRPDVMEYARQFVGDRASQMLMSGWSIECPLTQTLEPARDIILAKATSTSGLEFLLRCGTLDTMMTVEK